MDMFSQQERSGKADRHFKPTSWLILALVLVILAGLFGLWRIRSFQTLADSFQVCLDEARYEEAVKIYREIQDKSTAIGTGQANNKYRELQMEFEDRVAAKATDLIDKAGQGQEFSQDDRDFISRLDEISASAIAPRLEKLTDDFLEGKIDYSEWSQKLYAFQSFANLQVTVNNLLNQEMGLIKAQNLFAECLALEKEGDWEKVWQAWYDLTENREIGEYARSRASFLLKKYQEDQYDDLLSQADTMLSKNQYYSANHLLSKMYDVFPDNQSILDRINRCTEHLPRDIVVWEDMVEHLKLGPLRQTGEELADRFPDDQAGLLTGEEFRRLLEELHRQQYVLISEKLLTSYPESYPYIPVPKGKKPLVLVFAGFNYSSRQRASASLSKLMVNPEGTGLTGELSLTRRTKLSFDQTDAFSILDAFIKAYPDFSFDGAKAVITASGVEDKFLGYDLKREKEGLEPIIRFLTDSGYVFAASSYGEDDMGLMSASEFQTDLDKWQETFADLVGDSRILVFPRGSHVYGNEESLKKALAHGYSLFLGEGPRLFNQYLDGYMHVDCLPVNRYSLANYDQESFRRFFDPSTITGANPH